jgi:fluoride ion exporter CrcB/FEX
VLFPVKKEDVDVVENYFNDGYRRKNSDQEEEEEKEEVPGLKGSMDFAEDTAFSFENHDLALDEEIGVSDDLEEKEAPSHLPVASLNGGVTCRPADASDNPGRLGPSPPTVPNQPAQRNSPAVAPTPQRQSLVAPPTEDPNLGTPSGDSLNNIGHSHAQRVPHLIARQYAQVEGGNVIDYGTAAHPDLDQIITNVATGVSQKISRIRRVSLADGWDVGTTPEEISEDLMLGLRYGLCGALSSFSSWISSIVSLLRGGQIGQAFVGLVLGIQLPLIAYRFGQHVAVYLFVWRCRRETRRDERRGYGIRLRTDENMTDHGCPSGSNHSLGGSLSQSNHNHRNARTKGRRTVQEEESETPSVRAIITAIFILAFVAQMTSLNFFYQPEDRLIALSLLFSPLGVLTRWRLSKFNSWRPNFPIGTFACNIGACALSGSLGSLLAGNPGPRERTALVAVIAGFGGTLSSVARFIVEILAGMDPILFRMDGVYYAVCSVFWGLLVSFVFSASVDWADSVE